MGVCSDEAEEGSIQEQLDTFETELKNDGWMIATKIVTGPRWLSKVEQMVRDGDLLILFEKDHINSEASVIYQELKNRLAIPVLMI